MLEFVTPAPERKEWSKTFIELQCPKYLASKCFYELLAKSEACSPLPPKHSFLCVFSQDKLATFHLIHTSLFFMQVIFNARKIKSNFCQKLLYTPWHKKNAEVPLIHRFEWVDITSDLVTPTHHTCNPCVLSSQSSKIQIIIEHGYFESLKSRQKHGS